MDVQKRLLDVSLAGVRQLTSTDFAALALLDESERVVRWSCASGSRNDRYKRIVVRLGKCIPGTVMRTGRTLIVHSFHKQKGDDPSQYPILIAEDLKSFVACPLWVREQVVGVLLMGNRYEHQFSAETVEMMESTAEQLGSLLQSTGQAGQTPQQQNQDAKKQQP